MNSDNLNPPFISGLFALGVTRCALYYPFTRDQLATQEIATALCHSGFFQPVLDKHAQITRRLHARQATLAGPVIKERWGIREY